MDTLRPIDTEHESLSKRLASEGVRYVLGSWIDITGRAKSKVVPVDHMANLLAGSERYTPRGIGELGLMTPNEDECVALPDPSTLRVCPWEPRVAWAAADLLLGGREPFALCSRSILKRQVELAAAEGYAMHLGVEPEFFVFRPESLDDPSGYLEPMARSGRLRPTQAYDAAAALDALDFLDSLAGALQEAGFGLFSFDTEGGDGQYEFDFGHAPALEMADRMTFFRLMVRQLAERSGLVATFMPKPYTSAWGSGHHFNMSLVDSSTGDNLFRDTDNGPEGGWSKLAYCFVAGIIRHARAIAAIATPTVNSYKRLVPRLQDGSVSWAPVYAAYGDNNRSCLLRLPHNRPAVENRGVDSAANTYLAAAIMLAAGLEGIRLGLDPGPPVREATYQWTSSPSPERVRLPRTLLEAVDAFMEDPLVAEVFPPAFVKDYAEMKQAEWDEYHSQVTDWERSKYLLSY